MYLNLNQYTFFTSLQLQDSTKTPLGIASYSGHEREVELLLAAGANPDMHTKV